MDPKIWGGPLWKSLINIAKVYPLQPTINDKNYYRIFFTSLAYVLPCFSCRKNYQKHLAQIPIQLESRNQLLNWLHQIYNQTLINMKKPEVSYQQFINKYSDSSSISLLPNRKNIIILLLLLTLIFGVYYYFFYGRYNFPFSLR